MRISGCLRHLSQEYKRFVLFFFCTGLLLVPSTYTQEVDAVKAEVQKIINNDTDISFEEIPGIVMAIIDGEEIYLMGFGEYEDVSQDSLFLASFELGGLTKVFTAHLAKIILEKFDITPIADLGSLQLDIPPSINQITVKELLTHTSGLQNLPSNLARFEQTINDRYAHYGRQDLLEYLGQLEINPRKQNKYVYAHTNFALLEIILEQITDQPFTDLMQEHIFSDFSMISSYFDNPEKLENGYDRAGRKTTPWRFNSFAGSEGMRASISDLAMYLQTNLNAHPASSFQNLLVPHTKIPNAKRSWVADGWHLFRNKKYYDIYLHSGKTTGHGANMQFIPETRTGVIIMVNSPASLSGLGMLVLRMINDNWKRKVDGEEK